MGFVVGISFRILSITSVNFYKLKKRAKVREKQRGELTKKEEEREKAKEILQDNPLCRLPNELLCYVASHASPASVACLALSCRELLSRLRKQAPSLLSKWPKDRDSDKCSTDATVEKRQRAEFLICLSKDMPPCYYFCYCCIRIHRWPEDHAPQNSRSLCPTFDSGGDLSWSIYTHFRTPTQYTFRFSHLYLAMRRHRLGPEYGIPVDSLSHLEVDAAKRFCPCHPRVTLLSVDARICPRYDESARRMKSTLCLRIQQWARLSAMASCPLDEAIGLIPDKACFLISGHIHPSKQKEYLCRLNERNQIYPVSSRSPDSVLNSDYCLLQFQVQHCELQGPSHRTRPQIRNHALVITKWLDLGEGLDSNDPVWQGHTGYVRRSRHSMFDQDIQSIRERFEGQPGVSQEELTSRNRSLLEEDRFRTELFRVNKEKWFQPSQTL